MPVFWMVIYSWYGDLYTVETRPEGHLSCAPKETKFEAYSRNYDFWCILYLFIPAFLLLILNIAMVVQLKRADNIRRSLKSISYHHNPGSGPDSSKQKRSVGSHNLEMQNRTQIEKSIQTRSTSTTARLSRESKTVRSTTKSNQSHLKIR